MIFVNDGSKDNTILELKKLVEKDEANIKVVNFSRNFGHQIAVTAGLDNTNADYVAIIDADLQDDVNAIYKMVDKFIEGYDVVYGVRNSRDTDSFFKKHTALMYYSLMKKMGVNLVPDSADYRLLSKRATEATLQA